MTNMTTLYILLIIFLILSLIYAIVAISSISKIIRVFKSDGPAFLGKIFYIFMFATCISLTVFCGIFLDYVYINLLIFFIIKKRL